MVLGETVMSISSAGHSTAGRDRSSGRGPQRVVRWGVSPGGSLREDVVLVGHAVRHRQAGDVAGTVLAQVGGTLELGLGERLSLQRRQATDVVRADPQAVADPLTE